MIFDITDIDKVNLIKCLYIYSEPIGLGNAEYEGRRRRDENVIGLTDDECKEYLNEFYNDFTTYKIYSIVDYCKGKPIKLGFFVTSKGRVIVDTDSYDERNGLYRFFEALLNTYLLEEIKIVKKGYPRESIEMAQKYIPRSKEQIMIFKKILTDCIKKYDLYGRYWTIDEIKNKQINSLLDLIYDC